MDEDYLEHYYEQLDDWLYLELRHVRNEVERKSLIEGVKFKKREIKERFKEGKRKTASETNKLVLYASGRTTYSPRSGRKYEGKFSPQTNAYKLLRQLALFSQTIYSEDLAKYPGMQTMNDRSIRDTIKYIKDKLGLDKEDNFFIVDKGFFGLKCGVELMAS